MAPKENHLAETLQTGAAFLSAFPHYIRIDLSCKHVADETPHELLESLQENIKDLCKQITQLSDSLEATQWPSLFVVSSADGLTSKEAHQDRGSLLIGIKDPESDAALIDATILDWKAAVRKQPLFKDYYPPPLFEVRFVKQEDLGTLKVDQWMWPSALSSSPTLFSKSTPSGEDSFAFIADATSTEPSTTSPKKLNPASVILNRLKWDASFESKDYAVIYEDRHDGLMEISVVLWTTETSEEHFIPMHRIRSIRKKTTGQTVWHREERIDLISGSGT